MAVVRTQCSSVQATLWQRGLHSALVAAIALLGCVQLSMAQSSTEFHRTLTVTSAETVTLDVDVADGELQVCYGHDGEVLIAALAKSSAQAGIPDSFFPALLSIEQSGNHITIHASESPAHQERITILYRIDVPYRTKLTSKINSGKQVITGILGPVDAVTNKGEIKAAYISSELKARVGTGNLDLQVIGGYVDAVAGTGNISCARLPQGIRAETQDGDITLMVVGPSTATVVKGNGRIDVGGARGSLALSTDAGDLHVVAVPHDRWKLNSGSGTIRLDLPPVVDVALNASTDSGKLQCERDDIPNAGKGLRNVEDHLNTGKHIDAHTGSGSIVIR